MPIKTFRCQNGCSGLSYPISSLHLSRMVRLKRVSSASKRWGISAFMVFIVADGAPGDNSHRVPVAGPTGFLAWPHGNTAAHAPSENNQIPLHLPGDPRLFLPHKHIHLRADAEVFEVDAGLDGEAGPGHDAALVVGFQVVHIGAVAVHFLAYGVTGAMHEIVAVAAAGYVSARGVVHFVAAQLMAGRHCVLHPRDGGVARAAHDAVHLEHFVAGAVAAEAGPGDVVVHGAGLVELGPHVEQHQVAAANFGRDLGGRFVVEYRIKEFRMMHYFQDMKVFCAGALLPAALLLGAAARTEPTLPPRVVDSYGKLPLSFEANRGQTARQVKFLARGPGYTLFLTPDAAVLSLHRQKTNAVLRMKLQGANARASVTGADALPGKSNYFIGSDPSQWRTDVPTYAGVKYAAVYPGIDLVYHGNQRLLEYDFLVAPGADPRAIGIRFQGARKLAVNRDGALVIGLGGSEVIEPAPVVYQEVGGRRQTVAGRYVLRGKGRVGFSVAEYDRTHPLVIDPTLVYSTYLGSVNPGNGGNQGTSIAVDASGNAYVTGSTCSLDFPITLGAFQTTCGGGGDAFVSKLNAPGSALVYSTYLGGSGLDLGYGIAVDASGSAYVTGQTGSSDFPTTPGAFQTTYRGCSGCWNAFVSKLNASGSALSYSTYLGGSTWDRAWGIAVDASGNAYVTGMAGSFDFPTTPGAFQTTLRGAANVFVSKLNAAGSALVYSTYVGGSGNDHAAGIALDASGNAYVAGFATSSDFPTTPGAFQATLHTVCCSNAFVTKLNPLGSALAYSTYLGGSADDYAYGIAVDTSGNAYTTGFTSSTDFPTTPGAFQTTRVIYDAFVSKLNPNGSALVYSTYFYGGPAIAADASGNAYVTGWTGCDFPTTPDAFQTTCGGGDDAFVSELNSAGSALLYSTFLGGSNVDAGWGIAVDASGNVYVTGGTESSNFPTTPGAFQTTYTAGNWNGFVSK